MLAITFLRSPGWEREIGLIGCLWMGLEDLTCAGCGVAAWTHGPNVPGTLRLCVQNHHIGARPYGLLFSLALSYLIALGVRKWTSRKDRPI
jgi:hypothetical protein